MRFVVVVSRDFTMSSGTVKNRQQQSSLIDLVQEYEAAGWLSGKQAHEYSRLLQKHPESQEYVAKEIQKAVANKKKEVASSSSAAAPAIAAAVKVKPILHSKTDDHQHVNSRQHGIIWEDDSTKKKLLFEQGAAWIPICLEPSELKSVLKDDDKVKELFAEMCFFARLGFVQPPSCLRCTYKEGMMEQQDTAAHAKMNPPPCQRWVVWRKNADLLLHPDTLGDNIVIFQCHAVRKLLIGKQVEGCIWDTNQKQLVQTTLV